MMDSDIRSNDNYKVGTRYRCLFPIDILWLWSNKNKLSAYKQFFNFSDSDVHYAILSFSDPCPILGIIAQSILFLASKKQREFIYKRGW